MLEETGCEGGGGGWGGVGRMDKGWPELHPKASLFVSLARDVLLLVETGLWGLGGWWGWGRWVGVWGV